MEGGDFFFWQLHVQEKVALAAKLPFYICIHRMFSALDGPALQDRCLISKGLAWHELNIGDCLLVQRNDASFLEGRTMFHGLISFK
ncbi:hypothetical protein DPMN_023799 [Dreissena polymorpha]|uniref:Uncharacterized protein n=1 Tax=Dreissena polymorpha TaxID=45954 RepID=A0A9D4LQC8_DREPO|nr:hypothetical protein DPMN_023799 [Dreissena polymorpha]